MKQNEQQQGQNNSQSQGKVLTQGELESIIRGGKFNSQSDANSYLQQHGLSAQLKDDGTAEIFDQQQRKVATVNFQGSGQDQRSISNINYST